MVSNDIFSRICFLVYLGLASLISDMLIMSRSKSVLNCSRSSKKLLDEAGFDSEHCTSSISSIISQPAKILVSAMLFLPVFMTE